MNDNLTPAEQAIHDAAYLRGALEVILASPQLGDEEKIQKLRELLAAAEEAGQPRWTDTGSGAGWTEPSATELLRRLRAEVAALRDEVAELRAETD